MYKNYNMDAQESIQIIENMLQRTHGNMYKNKPYFLLWGVAVFLCSVLQFVFIKLDIKNNEYVWIAMPFIAIIHIVLVIKNKKERLVKTYSEEAINALWTSLGLAFIVLTFYASIVYPGVLPLFIILYGIGTYTTGKIISFKPLYWGGLFCFGISFLALFVPKDYHLLILAIAILMSYIIPALLLKKIDTSTP